MYNNSSQSSAGQKRGFTLVEMIVSLGVFSIVAVVALGALVKIVSANKKAQTLQATMNNLNFALETLSRELRVSPYYYCDTTSLASWDLEDSQGCSQLTEGGGTNEAYIFLKSAKVLNPSENDNCNAIYGYGIIANDDGTGYDIKKVTQETCGNGPISDDDFSSILDPNVTITGYYVDVDTGDPYPLATIRLSGYSGIRERERTYFDIQTSISPRVAQ